MTAVCLETLYRYGPDANSDGHDDWTQQTSKTVHEGLSEAGDLVEETIYQYNRQGRLSTVEVDSNANGHADTISEYTYNASGIRVGVVEKTDGNDDGDLEDSEDSTEATDYLVDDNNPTGYAQVLEERDAASGDLARSYTVGNEVLGQWDATNGALYLLYDGHGSTRMLLDATGQPLTGQIFRYDAFGVRLDSAAALTSLLYSGEQTDRTGLQYLRARYYDPATGRFNRLDPFAGNLEDPLSLHKYLYCHADPVNGIDPTGQFLSLISGLATRLQIAAQEGGACMAVRACALGLLTVAQNAIVVNWAMLSIASNPVPDGVIINISPGMATSGIAVAGTASVYLDFNTMKFFLFLTGEIGIAPVSVFKSPTHQTRGIAVNAGLIWNAPQPSAISGPTMVASVPNVVWQNLDLANPALPYLNGIFRLMTQLAKYNVGNLANREGVWQFMHSSTGEMSGICYGTQSYFWGGTVECTSRPIEIGDLNALPKLIGPFVGEEFADGLKKALKNMATWFCEN